MTPYPENGGHTGVWLKEKVLSPFLPADLHVAILVHPVQGRRKEMGGGGGGGGGEGGKGTEGRVEARRGEERRTGEGERGGEERITSSHYHCTICYEPDR